MAAFNFNTLQQKYLLSIALCKYPSSLNAFNFLCLSPSLILSPPKHTPFFVLGAHASNMHTKNNESSIEATNLRTKKENGFGFSSIKSGGERAGRQSANNLVNIFVEEKTGKRLTKDRNTREDLGFRRNKNIGSENSSTRYKSRNKEIKSSNSMDIKVVNNKMEKKTKTAGDNHVKEEKILKGSKRNKVDSPEVQFRRGLDMCCKKGDVMGAIQLYDLARREGIKLGQYQYAVLLYLCSSAATGIVQPAKSGSGGRTLNSLEVSNEASGTNVMELNELRNKSNKNFSFTESYTRFPKNGHQLIDDGSKLRSTDKIKLNSGTKFENLDNTSNGENVNSKANSQQLDQLSSPRNGSGSENHDDLEIQVSEDVKKYALERGFEVYEQMCMDEVPMNEPTLTAVARMAMSMNNGDMAFDMVRKMNPLGLNPKLRSYGPALSVFCNNGDVDKAFAVEEHMLEHSVNPEEPELEALLRVSVEAGKGDKVYYLLHKLRTSVRRVSPSTAGIIVRWFKSKAASRVGKRKWDNRVIEEAIENGGGGWHGQGWLGKGKWTISCTSVGVDAICKCCGEKLATIDLDPKETENFAESVASIAIKRDKDSSFQKFQKWLKYYGSYEAVIDGANVGLISQNRFIPSKINAIANGIRQKLPSKKWPLIVLHNKRVTGPKMNEPVNNALIEKWKNADSLYATPTGSNDDWYWLYAAIKFKCLIVTNDEMRDHTFQLLGNDFFPKWKERHQVRFNFTDAGPVFYMPPCFSVVIQESEKGHWHIPISTDHDYEPEREWLCITRAKSSVARKDSLRIEDSQSVDHSNGQARLTTQTGVNEKQETSKHGSHEELQNSPQEVYRNLRNILLASGFTDHHSVVSRIEAAEELGDCVIDFQI